MPHEAWGPLGPSFSTCVKGRAQTSVVGSTPSSPQTAGKKSVIFITKCFFLIGTLGKLHIYSHVFNSGNLCSGTFKWSGGLQGQGGR